LIDELERLVLGNIDRVANDTLAELCRQHSSKAKILIQMALNPLTDGGLSPNPPELEITESVFLPSEADAVDVASATCAWHSHRGDCACRGNSGA
jgi:hypothetical protein